MIAVGESSGRALQALVRVDPAGFATRELAERRTRTSHRRPRCWSSTAANRGWTSSSRWPGCPSTPNCSDRSTCPARTTAMRDLLRLTIRAPRTAAAELVRAAKEVSSIRSARKSDGALRVIVDPVSLA